MYGYPAAGLGELDGVGDQVPNDLLKSDGFSHDHGWSWSEPKREINIL